MNKREIAAMEHAELRRGPTPGYEHERRCWDCGNVAIHEDAITPWVRCKKCGSQDTRRVKQKGA